MDNLTSLFWNHIEANRDKKLQERIYYWLGQDNLGKLATDGRIFWIEKTWSGATVPDYVHDYIIKWAKKRGYQYLYEVK